MVVHKSQHGRKITDRISVIRPHNGERLTFIGQEGVGRQCARHGGQNALMKALDHPSGPHTICVSSDVPLKMSVAPKIAVTTDSVLVEQDPSRETRRRLEERKTVPDELDSKDAKGGAALGDPTSMRSWLSCLDIVEDHLEVGDTL